MSPTAAAPAVSVVVPTYQSAGTVGRAVESVLAQTLADWELLVVDDGSTDGTREVVAGYDDDRIRYVRQENAGANAARNRGIREAAAALVSFLDADDELEPRHLSVAVEVLQSAPADVVGVATAYRARTAAGTSVKVPPAEPVTFADVRRGNPIGSFTATTFRRSALREIGGLDEDLACAQDYDTYLRLLDGDRRVRTVREVLATKHDDEGRISADVDRKRRGLGRIVEKHGDALAPERLADHHYMIGFAHAEAGDLDAAAAQFRRAIRANPRQPFYYYHYLAALAGPTVYDSSFRVKRSARRAVQRFVGPG